MHHLPRWDELPQIDLYKEQVLELIDQVLTPLEIKPVSAAMINNYTKLKWIPAPIKKKYSRRHVSHILVIALLKDVFELSEITRAIQMEKGIMGIDVAYNTFVEELEQALHLTSLGLQQASLDIHMDSKPEIKIMRYAALTYAFHRSSRQLMFEKP